MERKKLELNINQPTKVALLYDEPIVGKNQYGNYYLYAIESEGEQYSFFAPEEIHESLQNCSKGDQVVLTKLAAERNKKIVTKYVLEYPKNGNDHLSNSSVKEKSGEMIIEAETNANTKSDHYYDTMLKSYKDALAIQDDLGLNGLVDISRIAITLFIARAKMPYSNGN